MAFSESLLTGWRLAAGEGRLTEGGIVIVAVGHGEPLLEYLESPARPSSGCPSLGAR